MTTILVIDDDVSILEVTDVSLRAAGYAVVTAQDAGAAMKIICGDDPLDIALVDFWLGDSDSISLFDALQEYRAGLPVIMMTGGSGTFPIDMSHSIARVSGAHEFLQKPIRRDHLLSVIERMLG